MFQEPTLFVIGAGASCELKFPSGDKLRTRIVEILKRDGQNLRFADAKFNSTILQICHEIDKDQWSVLFQKYLQAAEQIRRGLPFAVSIDTYMHAHQKNSTVIELAKLAICHVILNCEQDSPIAENRKSVVQNVSHGRLLLSQDSTEPFWLVHLAQFLFARHRRDNLTGVFANIAFIIFNYDRCVEYFLMNAMINYYDIELHEAVQIMNSVIFLHPYGQVGSLPWQRGDIKAGFGKIDEGIRDVASGIQTYTESVRSGVSENVKNLVAGASTVVFMGFGYLEQNMELLSVDSSKVTRVIATMYGISETDIPIATSTIASTLSRELYATHHTWGSPETHFHCFVERLGCSKLMANHRMRLGRNSE